MNGHIFYVPESVATTPASGECIADAYWIAHPTLGLAFYLASRGYSISERPSPQCNSDRRVVERFCSRMYPDHIVKRIPAVFMAHAQQEMRRLREAKP